MTKEELCHEFGSYFEGLGEEELEALAKSFSFGQSHSRGRTILNAEWHRELQAEDEVERVSHRRLEAVPRGQAGSQRGMITPIGTQNASLYSTTAFYDEAADTAAAEASLHDYTTLRPRR